MDKDYSVKSTVYLRRASQHEIFNICLQKNILYLKKGSDKTNQEGFTIFFDLKKFFVSNL